MTRLRIDAPSPVLPRRAFLALAAGGLVSACNTTPPADTFDLLAPADFSRQGGGTRAQLLVLEPAALKILDAQGIVVKPSPNEIEYLAKSQWPDRLPKVVQARLIEAFENTHRIRAVSRPGEGLVIDYQLVSDVRAFQANIAAGAAEVSISAKLVSDRSGKVMRSQVFDAAAPLASSEAGAVVQALNLAFDDVARAIVGWVFGAI
jgi:cholesterol transport system auxiliary component